MWLSLLSGHGARWLVITERTGKKRIALRALWEIPIIIVLILHMPTYIRSKDNNLQYLYNNTINILLVRVTLKMYHGDAIVVPCTFLVSVNAWRRHHSEFSNFHCYYWLASVCCVQIRVTPILCQEVTLNGNNFSGTCFVRSWIPLFIC